MTRSRWYGWSLLKQIDFGQKCDSVVSCCFLLFRSISGQLLHLHRWLLLLLMLQSKNNLKTIYGLYYKEWCQVGGTAKHRGRVCASHPAAPGLIPGVPEVCSQKFFREGKIVLMKKLSMLPRLINSTAASRSGQERLNYIDWTHLVLASGKLVLQKNFFTKCKIWSKKVQGT